MTNTVKRLILFFGAVPLLTALILLVPHYNHIGVIAILTVVGLLCGDEFRRLTASIVRPMPRWTIGIPAVVPILAWLVGRSMLPAVVPEYLLIAAVAWALMDAVFARADQLEAGILRMGTRLLMVMYPTWFLWWLARLTWFEDAGAILIFFMLAVFLNDSGAWLFGNLFGRHRGIVPASPNKSLEGYLGGVFGSFVVVFATSWIRPDLLPHPTWQLILFALLAAVATIGGDLVESAFKRSLGVKDSGRVIMGRGGMLDSVDSILFTAPVFVVFLELAPK